MTINPVIWLIIKGLTKVMSDSPVLVHFPIRQADYSNHLPVVTWCMVIILGMSKYITYTQYLDISVLRRKSHREFSPTLSRNTTILINEKVHACTSKVKIVPVSWLSLTFGLCVMPLENSLL